MPAASEYEQVSSSAEGDALPLDVRHDGWVWVRYAADQQFERAWFSLITDDTLTVRSGEGGPVLRTANARLCQVSSMKAPPQPPYEHAVTVTLRQPDSEGCREYVLSHGLVESVDEDADRYPSTRVPTEFDQHPRALRQWIQAFSGAASKMSGAWEWQFAVIFGLLPTDDDHSDDSSEICSLMLAKDALQELVENWCISFHRWHFEVAVAERTEQTKDRIIVLLRMDDCHIEKYFRELQIDRWQRSSDGIMLQSSTSNGDATTGYIAELQLTMQHRVATMAYVLS